MQERKFLPYVFLAPAALAMILLVFYPLSNGVALAFTNATERTVAKWIGSNYRPATYVFTGFENFTRIFEGGSEFYRILIHTLIWTALNVILHVSLGLLVAILLNQKFKGRTIYRVLLIIPWAVPSFVSAFSWRYIFNSQYGFVNLVLGQLGLGQPSWTSTYALSLFVAVVANTWLAIPFNMVTLLGGLQSIPSDLYEAADVDGANRWQSFLYVTIPMLRPVLSTIILLGTIWTFNSFNVIFLVTAGAPSGETEILATYAYRLAFEGIRNYGGAAAYSLVILAILLGFTFFYNRILNRNAGVAA